MKKQSVVAGLVVVVAGVSAFVGTASAVSAAQRDSSPAVLPAGFGYASAVVDEYQRTVASFSLRLPEGYSLPERLPTTLAENVIYEDGVGESYAYFYWQCAWIDAALNLDNIESRLAKETLAELDHWDETAFYDKYVEEGEFTWEGTVLAAALEGDVTPISQYFEVNCQEFSNE